ncbi:MULTISPECIES: hypothetical protein [unclassified Aurantimonas]|uniref:hypothetical protein n=1 Tax=unclassified Aurantimonas TaxID=2638230 RepID=UPI002E18A671|nr:MULTISPECIES: hypothetical protein [unclassified Aurantimonas]MEC5293814.1 hypothetical protein [Aurantimonas sp. C2-3-R2]MEC5414197.1 hypothetical protein [Aurantimonas sp. C2-4-R8]
MTKRAKGIRSYPSEDIEETLGAIRDRAQLRKVLQFLDDYGADKEMYEAVRNAIGEVERWIIPEVEKAYLCGKLQHGDTGGFQT